MDGLCCAHSTASASQRMLLVLLLLIAAHEMSMRSGLVLAVEEHHHDHAQAWQGPDCSLSPGRADSCAVAGDTVALGGLFPLHSASTNPRPGRLCGNTLQGFGFERMEAMRYAINKVNQDAGILPGIKLAFEMRDTCLSPPFTNQQTVRFVQRADMTTAGNCLHGLIPISGVVGAASSGPSIAAANLLRIFRIPQVSYASTSATLSENRYTYFLRTVPPDIFQAKALVGIVHALNMTYPGVMSTGGPYGTDGAKEVTRELVARGSACIAANAMLGLNTPNTNDSALPLYQKAVHDLTDTVSQNARATVAFSGRDAALSFMQYLAKKPEWPLDSKFTWLATDSWIGDSALRAADAIEATKGTLGVAPTTATVDEFSEYFLSLNPRNNTGEFRNPWLNEFWHEVFKCDPEPCWNASSPLTQNCSLCLSHSLRNATTYPYAQNSKVPFVIDAVFAFAHALDALQKDRCAGKGTGLCAEMKAADRSRNGSVDGEQLLSFLKRVQFPSTVGGRNVSFDNNGDLESALYQIYNIQQGNGTTGGNLKAVGHWEQLPHNHTAPLSTKQNDSLVQVVACSDPTEPDTSCSKSRLVLRLEDIRWRDGSRGRGGAPTSQCSAPCQPGQQARPMPNYPHSVYPLCCWMCVDCVGQQFITRQNDTCAICPANTSVGVNHTTCSLLDKDVFDLRDKSGIAVLLAAVPLLVLDLLLVPIVIAVMDILPLTSALRFHNMMSCVIGIALVYVLALVNYIPPSLTICTIRAVLSTVALALMLLPFAAEFLHIIFMIRAQNKLEQRESVGESSNDTPTGRRRSSRRRMSALTESRSLSTWVFAFLTGLMLVVTVLSIAIDNPDVNNVITPNQKWLASCSLSAPLVANFVMTLVIIVSIFTLRIYYLYKDIYTAWTLRMAAFMMIAILMFMASLTVAYALMTSIVVKEAMINFIHFSVALGVYIIVVMDLMRTLAPEQGSKPEPGRMTAAAADDHPGIGSQIARTLTERSLFNAERRQERRKYTSEESKSSASLEADNRSNWTGGENSGGDLERVEKPSSFGRSVSFLNPPKSEQKADSGMSGHSEYIQDQDFLKPAKNEQKPGSGVSSDSGYAQEQDSACLPVRVHGEEVGLSPLSLRAGGSAPQVTVSVDSDANVAEAASVIMGGDPMPRDAETGLKAETELQTSDSAQDLIIKHQETEL